jgi:hypothetical protein
VSRLLLYGDYALLPHLGGERTLVEDWTLVHGQGAEVVWMRTDDVLRVVVGYVMGVIRPPDKLLPSGGESVSEGPVCEYDHGYMSG